MRLREALLEVERGRVGVERARAQCLRAEVEDESRTGDGEDGEFPSVV